MKTSSVLGRRGGKLLNAFLSLILVAGLLPAVQLAAPEQAYAEATQQVSVVIKDSTGAEMTLATWAYDSDNQTYKDSATNAELSIVKDFTQEANQKGTVNGVSYDFSSIGALAYTGINRKPDPRCLAVVKKGILLDDFYAYAASKIKTTADTESSALEILQSDDVKLAFCSSVGTHSGSTDTYANVWGKTRYYYPAWYNASTSQTGEVSEELQEGGIAVPSTLAITSYHQALYGGSQTTPADLIKIADTEKSLRVMTGQVAGGSTSDINMGQNSTSNVSYIEFTASKTFAELGIKVPVTEILTINNAEDLVTFAETVANGNTYEGKTVTLAADIDLSSADSGSLSPAEADSNDVDFNGIGSADKRFAGTFDGQGHTIKGIAINTAENVAGLFAATTNTATIKDFTATGTLTCTAATPAFTKQLFGIGGIVGVNRGTISGVTSNIAVTASTGFTTGGIAGFNAGEVNAYGTSQYGNAILTDENGQKGNITSCIVNADVYGYKIVGGIVGENAGNIDSCLVFGDVENATYGGKNGTGGIAGRNGCNNNAYETGNITNCGVFGKVESNGDKWIGGIAGFSSGNYGNPKATSSSIKNCFFVGTKSTKQSSYNNAIAGNQESLDGYVENNYALTYNNSGSSEKETGIKKDKSWFSTTEAASALSSGSRWVVPQSTDAVTALLKENGFEGFVAPLALASSDATEVSTSWSGMNTVKTSYIEGQTFDMGSLKCGVTYSDGVTAGIPLVASKTDAFTVEDNGSKVTVSTEDGAYSLNFTVTVAAKKVSKIAGIWGSYAPTVTTYSPGDTLDLTGLKARITYDNGTTEDVVFDTTLPEGWTVNLTSPLTAEQNGTALKLTYTLDGVATEFAPCYNGSASTPVTISVLAAPSKDEENNYLISSVDDLTWFAAQVNQRGNVSYKAKQTADLDLSGLAVTPIGNSTSKAFTGTYDGNGYKITYSASTSFVCDSGYGLVAVLDENGTVKNVTTTGELAISQIYGAAIAGYVTGAGATVENCTNQAAITAKQGYAGGIVGSLTGANSTIKNCKNEGAISTNNTAVGGIVGNVNVVATITGCTNKGDLTSTATYYYSIGGIAGGCSKATISQCINDGNITATCAAAGISASLSNGGVISQCANHGAVTSSKSGAAGIVKTISDAETSVTDCYNMGSITSTDNSSTTGVSGIVGDYSGNKSGATITNCYNAGTITGEKVNNGALLGYAKNTATFKNCYYVGTADTVAVAGKQAAEITEAGGFTYKSLEEMEADTFAATLGTSFAPNVGTAYAAFATTPELTPVLTFEDVSAPAVGASISSEAADLEVGKTFTVNVTMAGKNITAAEEGLTYNDKAVKLVSIDKGAGLSSDANFYGNTEAGTFNFVNNEADSSAGIVVATYTFECIAPSTNTSIAFGTAECRATTGSLDTEGIVIATADTTVNLPVLAAGLEKGDVNDSGVINIVDAQVAYDLGKGAYTTEGSAAAYDKFFALEKYNTWTLQCLMKVADVNDSGEIDSLDAFAIQYRVVTGQWGSSEEA